MFSKQLSFLLSHITSLPLVELQELDVSRVFTSANFLLRRRRVVPCGQRPTICLNGTKIKKLTRFDWLASIFFFYCYC